ncbi:hypothetical protein KIH31_03690 [Paenarthrobacter sp. DKR-5]|uniref:hypothetical protein n=1 Tax=Paenarthrobacter sp. DKR-5 TaxID=2835535 RepID=UPI001BDD5F96|nr:hypothetical protein [Paenarthrobacter sp. DKR-5]MBT1001695.1 hypothetical protein [Paenarthrobacter sp. DKR-5]
MKYRPLKALRPAAVAAAVTGLTLLTSGLGLVTPPAASAAGGTLLYSYVLGKSTTSVPNAAPVNTAVPLSLYGNVSIADSGSALRFDGNTVDQQSVGYAKPASGTTMAAAASESYGAAVKFTFELPGTQKCFTDSPNYTQIGRFGTGLSQLKIQMSKCSTNTTAVFPECRVAGTLSATTIPVVRGTQALIPGKTHIITCIKSPDRSDGTSTVTVETTRLEPTGNITTTNTVKVARTGDFSSTAYLTVANKYQLPAQQNNTDQAIGNFYGVSYCKATLPDDVRTCLTATAAGTATSTSTGTGTGTSTGSTAGGTLLYSYVLGKSTTSVPNAAPVNTAVPLSLYGNVSIADSGSALRFDGNTVDQQSVGYAKPASGTTMAAAASESYGAAVKFTFELPGTQKCFTDSPNYTQIGRFGTGLSQLKIQMSKCSTNTTAVFPECRVAGTLSATTIPVVRGTQALIPGKTHIITCIKSPDRSDGTSTVTVETTRLEPTGNITTTNTVKVARTGDFSSTAYLTVANKYQLPAQQNNTDQAIGNFYGVSYCKATLPDDVRTCLTAAG